MKQTFDAYFTQLKNKKTAVLGLGVSNRPLVKLLLSYGCDVLGCDKAEPDDELKALGCRLQTGEGYLDNIDADVVFRTPGMHPENPALQALRAKGALVTSEMDVFFALCPCRIIGITGSDGKTTTSTLIAEMLKAAGKRVWLGGNIGTPLLNKIPEMQAEDFAVVELSSFQLLDMTHSPCIAVVTNLAPNHLDVHKDMDEYITAKKNIFKFQAKEDLLVLNADNAITKAFAGNGRTRFFSRLGKGDSQMNGDMLCRDGVEIVDKKKILIPGEHNVENYLAAITAVEGLVPDSAIRQVAGSFGGVEHRIELVRIKDGVRYYNDSIASSPTRTIAGLKSFSQKVLLIAGGYDKHIPYDVLGPQICKSVKTLYLNGATADLIRKAVEQAPEYSEGNPEIVDCGNLDGAIDAAARDATEGDVVLLSPASAAFDQFRNFMVRGDYFKKKIGEL